jgi:DAACS family dicarboxylate/amino acid:cation (Na+ or H+) symporter
MYIRVLIGVGLGLFAGLLLKSGVLPAEWASRANEIGMTVIRLIKALATPLILFAVMDAFLRTRIPAKKGFKLIAISTINAVVALLIGIGLANLLRPGDSWQGKMGEITAQLNVQARPPATQHADAPTLDPIQNALNFIPDNLIDPFGRNNVITVVLLAVLAGAALRRVKDRATAEGADGIRQIDGAIHAVFLVLTQMLEWVVGLIPFAMCFVVAGVVGKTGLGVFGLLGSYVGTVVLGLGLHAVVYYSILLFVVARVSPLRFFARALDAIVTAFSTSSSLATLPVTLKCLQEKLKVSPGSARLAACVGTNLNHDGIILYEAVAVLFLAQALGRPLAIEGQVQVALASVMGAIGIAGVPEAGLITLSLVLGTAGLPADLCLLVVPVDWLLGRCRAVTNVVSDMTVAQLLDRIDPEPAPELEPTREVA